MREADSMLRDLLKSREDLLVYKNNIEIQLRESQKTISFAMEQDQSEFKKPLTEQDAVWHAYLLKIFIDIKNSLDMIERSIALYDLGDIAALSANKGEMAQEPFALTR
jgi:hypothetical protein